LRTLRVTVVRFPHEDIEVLRRRRDRRQRLSSFCKRLSNAYLTDF
jgi:hypothetical protein